MLFAKQDGEALSGTLEGKVGRKRRKYRHLKSKRGYLKGSIFNNRIQAEPLERAVFGLIADLLKNPPELRERIKKALLNFSTEQQNLDDLQALRDEREKIAGQFRKVYSAALEDQEDLAPLLDRLRSQRQDLDRRIDEIQKSQRLKEFNPDFVVDSVVQLFENFGADEMAEMPVNLLRALIVTFVARIEVDMETRDAEVYLKVPTLDLKSSIKASEGGRLAASSRP